MRKLRLTLQYIGTQYVGWQIQPNGLAIQEVLEGLLAKTLSETVRVVGAGRTDSGVHAFGQVAHFQTAHSMDLATLKKALNAQLPDDIAVRRIEEVPRDFHALVQAVHKTYVYLILNSTGKEPFLKPYVWQQYGNWQIEKVRECLEWIRGKHDFRAFCAADTTAKTTERNLLQTSLRRLPLSQVGRDLWAWVSPGETEWGEDSLGEGDEILAFAFRGEGFLKHMVRNLVGTLRDVGLGKISPQDFKNILQSKDRRQAGVTAPARGLFMVHVEY